LMKGDLGFPHRGFPAAVEAAILKGGAKRTIRAGLQISPADFAMNRETLSAKWAQPITDEMSMSSIMYPGVFRDFMSRRASKGLLLRYIPTPVYFYAMQVGQSFNMQVPDSLVGELLGQVVTSVGNEVGASSSGVRCELKRVGPLKESCRSVVFGITLAAKGEVEYTCNVKDSTGAFVFSGPMANAADACQVASPMPGAVLEILVKKGQSVRAGDTLMVISAMKMEVKSTAPHDGVVGALEVELGARVVEGCLLCSVKK
jgi:pyruvate carboxylase